MNDKVKHILSYLYPVLIESRPGELSDLLEVRKSRGKYILDSRTVNYSYGGLHQIFNSLFRLTHIEEQSFNNVLLLGMGAGSVISLLTEKYTKKCIITAIENDGIVIELAKKYFAIQRFNSLAVIKEDAFRFTSETNKKYDLIIVDLFIDNEVPGIFMTSSFINNLRKIAADNCIVIFNKTTETPVHKKELNMLYKEFELCFPGSEVIKLVSHGMENSFIYHNSLPVAMNIIKEEVQSLEPWSDFKPAYSLYNEQEKVAHINFLIEEFELKN